MRVDKWRNQIKQARGFHGSLAPACIGLGPKPERVDLFMFRSGAL